MGESPGGSRHRSKATSGSGVVLRGASPVPPASPGRADFASRGAGARWDQGNPRSITDRRLAMKMRISAALAAIIAAGSLAACDTMTRQEKAVATGAVVGGVVGSAATDGSTLGTVGGAVAGGVVGNEVAKRRGY